VLDDAIENGNQTSSNDGIHESPGFAQLVAQQVLQVGCLLGPKCSNNLLA